MLIGAEFWTFVLVFLCHVTHVTLMLAVSKGRPPVPYGANFLPFCFFLTHKAVVKRVQLSQVADVIERSTSFIALDHHCRIISPVQRM